MSTTGTPRSFWPDDLGSSIGELVFYAASGCGGLADQRNSSPEVHIAWNTTASFRATATLQPGLQGVLPAEGNAAQSRRAHRQRTLGPDR